ncbi:MAG: DUF4372 domain-containing protein [Candidatus Marinimicrobia bacterium]|nr:DUF4372 domain-containing protein [Candidatus Neomarinimicrobiota bacterium]MCH7763627.1 DUF4372 domain-containing protein [Candidatus Neomarinimicrobiota bacterium]
MYEINTIMLELLNLFPRYEFEKHEKRYDGNHCTKYFSGWQQLITLLFAQEEFESMRIILRIK